MHFFEYKDKILCCDDMGIERIAEKVGTPFYLYSYKTLVRHIHNIDGAFKQKDHLTCYSVKANSNLALLNILAKEGIGADVTSGGELFRSLKADFPPEKIVYSGVGKTDAEIRYALEAGILCFNVESIPELKEIDRLAGEMNRKVPLAFRVNPDVDPKTHPYISTGLKKNKFGISHSRALESYQIAANLKNVRIIGIDAHIGSQITEVGPFIESAKRLVDLVNLLKENGIYLAHIDIGGGLGIRYGQEEPPEPPEWAKAIETILAETGCRIIIEPGRSVVGNAGILVTKVLYVKEAELKTFVIVDAGMNDLIRPSLYDSYHEIRPVIENDGKIVVVDVVGPICESGDFLARDREMPVPKQGDLLAVMSAGAYGMVMSSNYNARPRAAEVLVKNGEAYVVRDRESYEGLISGERIVD